MTTPDAAVPRPVPSWPRVGERVILHDRDAAPLHGAVVSVDENAIGIRWDHMWEHHQTALVGVGSLDRLSPEAEDPR